MNSCGCCNVTCMKFDYLTKYASGANYIQNEDESTVAWWVHAIKECVAAVKQTSKCNCPKIAWIFNWATCSCGIMAFWVIQAAWSVSICCKKHYWQCYWLMWTWPNNKNRIVCNRENSKCEWTRECLCPLVKHPDAAVNIPACVMYSILDISLPPSPTPIPFPFPCSENWIEGN